MTWVWILSPLAVALVLPMNSMKKVLSLARTLMGFNYATASVGANHCYGYAGQEIFGSPVPRVVDRFTEADKGDLVKYNQDKTAMSETGIACGFSSGWGWIPHIFGKMLTAVTGAEQFADAQYL